MVIFCVVPSIGVAFNEIVVEQEESVKWYFDPHVLLCYLGAIFLVLLGLLDSLAEDPAVESKRPRLKQEYRMAIYMVA